MTLSKGNSGGPIVDEQKGIIGLVVEARVDEINSLSYLIDITKVADWWTKRGSVWPY